SARYTRWSLANRFVFAEWIDSRCPCRCSRSPAVLRPRGRLRTRTSRRAQKSYRPESQRSLDHRAGREARRNRTGPTTAYVLVAHSAGREPIIAPILAWTFPSGVTLGMSPSFGLNSQSHGFLLRCSVAQEINQFAR